MRITKMCDWDKEQANAIRKMALIDLLDAGLHKAYLQKMQYLWSTTTRNTTKQARPVTVSMILSYF